MKKKAVFKIIIFTLIILIILLGGLLLSEKRGFIENVGNIKSKKIEEKEITRIDVTDLEDGGSVIHEHTFKTMYDANEHWEECTVCGQKNAEVVHTYETKWALGYESCRLDNYKTYICSCGYSYVWHKPCVWKGKYTCNTYDHGLQCSICGRCICYKYYWNTYGSGILYDGIENGRVKCTLSSGKEINCLNGGTCSICKTYWKAGAHKPECNQETGKIYCVHCKTEYGTYSETLKYDDNIPKTYTLTSHFKLNNGATFNSLRQMDNDMGLFQIATQTVKKGSYGETDIIVEGVVKFRADVKIRDLTYQHLWFDINGVKSWAYTLPVYVFPDVIEPEILKIEMQDGSEELTEWSRTKPIIISGTENYLDIVNIKIVDDKEDIIFDGDATVTNNNFSISCIPELEVDTNGKTFKTIVTDSCGNSTSKEFKIAKVDAIPPTVTSGDDIAGQWAKSRKFTFKATDYGIGEVSIAFNDIKNLSLANFDGVEYTRDYEFYGDVYGEKQLSVLYRDGLGNTSIQKITINNLDNTAPTITKASIHNNVVSVEAHDRHETLGEGSGIIKYRYVASSEKIDNIDVSNVIESTSDKFIVDDVYKVKYIYIVAEDAAQNVSEVYELKVPELILTSSVDLSIANGKGGVILDWSTYDVSDKYFVVYRKEENATDWETIVSLDKKLTGNTYTDILGNDKSKPDVPNINITGDAKNNNTKIEATSNDNGTKYLYYIEAYDDNGTLLKNSI